MKATARPPLSFKPHRLSGIYLRALVLALFAYVGSGIGVTAVRTWEIFEGSGSESLPLLEATEIRGKTFHESRLHHHRRWSARQCLWLSHEPDALHIRIIRDSEDIVVSLDASPPTLRAPPLRA